MQLPLLQDLVKSQAEGKGVVDTISGWLDSKKVKFTPDKASVYVRLLEDQRLGMLPEPAGPNTAGVTFPPYVGEKLEPAFLKKAAGKPYAKAIPRGSTSEDFVTENNALMAAAMGAAVHPWRRRVRRGRRRALGRRLLGRLHATDRRLHAGFVGFN